MLTVVFELKYNTDDIYIDSLSDPRLYMCILIPLIIQDGREFRQWRSQEDHQAEKPHLPLTDAGTTAEDKLAYIRRCG